MNFKRIGRSLICLLLVCTLLVGLSPIRAKALTPELFVSVAAPSVLISILKGLGLNLTGGWDTIEARVLQNLTDHLVNTTDYVMDGLVDIAVRYSDASTEYANAMAYVDQGLVEAVRDWLFDSETVSIAPQEYTALSLSISSYYNLLSKMSSMEFPLFLYLRGCGVADKVLVWGCSSSRLYGFYFDMNGIFTVGHFTNPYGVSHAQYVTYHNLSDLEVVSTYQGTSPLFYSTSVAESYPDYLTTSLYAFDWEATGDYLYQYGQYRFYAHTWYKPSTDSVWKNCASRAHNIGYDSVSGDFSRLTSFTMMTSYTPGELLITVPSGLTTGHIAPQSQTLDEGYADWVKNRVDIALEEAYEAHIAGLPIALGGTDKETAELDQAAVWAGLGTWSGTGTGGTTNPDIGTGDDTDIGEEDEKVVVPFPDLGTSGGSTSVDTSTWTDADWWAYETENTAIGFNSLFSQIAALPKAIVNAFAKPFENVSAWISNQTMAISNFFDAATAGIRECFIELFLPAEDYLTAKVDTLCAEFEFAGAIVTTAKELKNGLSGISTSPPIIYIDLGATRGSYDIGGKTVFVDLSWYEEYKPTVDNIISAFLWICFVWKMLLKAPGLISGMPGDWVMSSANAIGITEHLPSRKAGYEVQRISNRETIRKGKG